MILKLNNAKPPAKKTDYWNSGFGDDFDDIPEAKVSECAVSQSAHSSAVQKIEDDPVVIEDDYSFDEDPVIELKTKQNEANVRQGVENMRFKDILLNKHSSESSRQNSVISNPMECEE